MTIEIPNIDMNRTSFRMHKEINMKKHFHSKKYQKSCLRIIFDFIATSEIFIQIQAHLHLINIFKLMAPSTAFSLNGTNVKFIFIIMSSNVNDFFNMINKSDLIFVATQTTYTNKVYLCRNIYR